MTRDETVALFLECEAKRAQARAAALAGGKSERDANATAHEAAKAHWNAWAEPLLAERKAMEADGRWAAEKDVSGSLEPRNAETRGWMEKATSDFSRCLFLLRGVEGIKETAGEEKENKDGELPVKSILLEGEIADFSGFVFPSGAGFDSTTFSGTASFASAAFSGTASFKSATFSVGSSFASATFSCQAGFDGATCHGNAYFYGAAFSGNAYFNGATFSGTAWFESATFSGDAWFESVTFSGYARFARATFSGDATFGRATFSGTATFGGATFSGGARFGSATFSHDARFISATFKRNTVFTAASFRLTSSFYAIRGERGFDMAGATFEAVPDFIQAHFEEAPRLDNMKVLGHLPFVPPAEPKKGEKLSRRVHIHRRLAARSTAYRRIAAADPDIPSRWRALKRLAIQGHDTERELEYHAREVQSQRFAEHWPVPWLGFFPFVSGYLYEIFSDFGRSLIRPALFWGLAIAIGAVAYVSQSPGMIEARQGAKGAPAVLAATSDAWHAWVSHRRPCHAGQEAPPKDKNGDTPVYVGALSPSLASGTDLANEAWHLAFRNAFIVLDGSGEAAHRTYGCLYGVELYGGGNPLAVVPSAVSTVSAAQKLFSALMIFLFGLALRNMLKMK